MTSPALALFVREWRIARRIGGGASIGAMFFLILVAIMPFALGPDLNLLASSDPRSLDRRAALDPARPRPAVPGRLRRRFARRPRQRRAAAGGLGADQMRRPLDFQRAAANRRQPAVRHHARDGSQAPGAGRPDAPCRNARADHDRRHRRRPDGLAAPRRPTDGGARAAADDPRPDLRRLGRLGRERRRSALP